MWYADWDRESDRDVEIAARLEHPARRDALMEIGGFDER